MKQTPSLPAPTTMRRILLRPMTMSVRFLCLIACCTLNIASAQAQLVLSDFSGTGFDWKCCGFEQQVGPQFVTVTGDEGWGIADVRTDGLDLTSLVNDRFQIRVRTNPENTAKQLSLGLVDDLGNEAKWWFDVDAQVTPGSWSTLVSTETIGQPDHGTGDWQNIDLANISSARLLGHWQHPGPFDMSIDTISISRADAYAGIAPDANWREQANQQIDEFRKANLSINVTDRLGNPLPDAVVQVDMQQHEFGFGSAVQAHRLRSHNPRDNANYRDTVERLFNMATIENNLKWPAWEGEWGQSFTQSGAARAIDWLNERDIAVRGHTLIWPGLGRLSSEAKAILNQLPLSNEKQTQLRQLIVDHITDVAGEFSGQLAAWDVVNEPRANHDVMDALTIGDSAMVEWFQAASQADPTAELFLNDYGILTSTGNTDSPNQREYFETLQSLIDQGAPIDGIGLQSHFRENTLTGAEPIWEILDRFESLGLDIQITEFDFDTTDEQLQAQFTGDFLTAAFAHPAVDAFVSWGFHEDAHWRPDAAMFRSDWSIKPNGETFERLVFDEWWTDTMLTTDAEGDATTRGFKGQYLVSAELDGERTEVAAQLSDDATSVTIVLDVLSDVVGDFNDDGQVDSSDIDWLSEQLTSETSLGLEFDLNADGVVNFADHETMVAEILNTVPGDADLDGRVQFSDFGALSVNYGSTGGWLDGDFTGDGRIQFHDFALLARHFGRSAAAVPEPNAFSMTLLSFLLTASCFRRSRTG